jgi:hypothetical protein
MKFRAAPVAAYCVFALVLTDSAMAQQDACIALLQHGIYANHVRSTSSQSYAEFKSNFCSWYSQYRESHTSAAAGLSIPIADIPIGLSGNMTYGEADALKSAVCSNVASQNANNQTFLDAAQFIDPNGAAAFTSCVQAEAGGLKIQSTINDEETTAIIAVAYQPPLGAQPATLNRVDLDGWTCARPDSAGADLRDLIGRRGLLGNDQHSVACHRVVAATPFEDAGQKVVAKAGFISISTTAGTFTQQFRHKLFEDPIADTAKVLASYPKGTILPFAGPQNTIPAGWHICDGHQGTVNLLDRLPIGASTDQQIGGLEGKASHTHTFTTSTPHGAVNVDVKQEHPSGLSVYGTDHTHSGATSDESNLPPVTRVYFIEKVS